LKRKGAFHPVQQRNAGAGLESAEVGRVSSPGRQSGGRVASRRPPEAVTRDGEADREELRLGRGDAAEERAGAGGPVTA
jgi:hypothetical protein